MIGRLSPIKKPVGHPGLQSLSQTLQKLFLALQNEWQNIPKYTIQNLVASMHCYCASVIVP